MSIPKKCLSFGLMSGHILFLVRTISEYGEITYSVFMEDYAGDKKDGERNFRAKGYN